MSDSLWSHGLCRTRLLCLPLSPGVRSNSCLLGQWCYLTISFSVTLFSSCLQSFQHQGLFQWVGSLHQVAKVLELQLQHLYSSQQLKAGLWSLPKHSPFANSTCQLQGNTTLLLKLRAPIPHSFVRMVFAHCSTLTLPWDHKESNRT